MELLGDPLDLENWYHLIDRELTFETSFLSLSNEDLDNICNVHDNKMDVGKLSDLAARIEPLLGKNGSFVKLSTRSCKDWCLKQERTKRIFERERGLLMEEKNNEMDDDVLTVIAIVRAMSFALRVESSSEVVDMLCNSERSYQDCFRRKLADNRFPMQLVVRKWEPLLPEMELRGFVFNKKLTGLAQYYKACFAPELVRLQDRVKAAALATFHKIKDRLPISNYVIDVVYVPERDVCLLIELNHWSKTTSSSLFSWEDDIEALENGPFEFRIVSAPIENVRSLIAAPLRIMAGWPPVVVTAAAAAAAAGDVGKLGKSEGRKPAKEKPGFVGRMLAKEASSWRAVRALEDETIKKLNALMTRRVGAPFFTAADVSLLPANRQLFLRGLAEGADAASSVIPTLYIVLFCRIANHPFKLVETTLCTLVKKEFFALDAHNAALVLKEIGLIEKIVKHCLG